MTWTMMSTVSLHFQGFLWVQGSPPPASPVRMPTMQDRSIVCLALRNGPAVEIISGTLLNRTVAYMICPLWPLKSSPTLPRAPPPPLVASLFQVTVLVTCSGEPRFTALSTQYWARLPAQPPLCRHGTWPPLWLKSCQHGKPVILGILHRLSNRRGLVYQTFCLPCPLLAMLLHQKDSWHWSSGPLRKAPSSCRFRVAPVCLPKNPYHAGHCLHFQGLMGSHQEVEWAPVRVAGSRRGLYPQRLSQPSPYPQPPASLPSQWAPVMERTTPAMSTQGSVWLPSQPQYLPGTASDTSSCRSVFMTKLI